MLQGVARRFVDQFNIFWQRLLPMRECQEHREYCFSQRDCCSQNLCGGLLLRVCQDLQPFDVARPDDLTLARKRDQIGVVLQVLNCLFRRIAAADAVSKIERKMTS